MQRAMALGPRTQDSNVDSHVSFSREGVLSQYWLRAYKEEAVPKAPKQDKERAAVSRYGQKGWSKVFSVVVRSFLPQ